MQSNDCYKSGVLKDTAVGSAPCIDFGEYWGLGEAQGSDAGTYGGFWDVVPPLDGVPDVSDGSTDWFTARQCAHGSQVCNALTNACSISGLGESIVCQHSSKFLLEVCRPGCT